MIINNLPAKYKALMEVIWEMDTNEQVISFVKTLPMRDMLAVSYLVELAVAGGDEVDDVSDAKREIDRIAAL